MLASTESLGNGALGHNDDATLDDLLKGRYDKYSTA